MTTGGPLQVLIAPDCFGESLTAVQAAQAIADGWRQARPADALTLAPQSDGGPGFVDVLASPARQLRHIRVAGPLDDDVDAAWVFDDASAHRLHRMCAGVRSGVASRAAVGADRRSPRTAPGSVS